MDNSILFQLFGGVFATLLHHPGQSRDPECKDSFQWHFRNFRQKIAASQRLDRCS
jgi:hypothetical protein